MLDEQQWNKIVFEKVQGMDNNWNAGIDHANSKDAQGKYIRKNQKSENGECGVQFMYYGKKSACSYFSIFFFVTSSPPFSFQILVFHLSFFFFNDY